MSNKIIETFDLSKIYKLKSKENGIVALNKINLSIHEGEKFGLLGPNGAGKTTLIQILSTLLQPTSGYATIDCYNILKEPIQAKARIALMLENWMLYYRITAYNNLKFFCRLYKVPNYKPKILEMAEEFGLSNWLNELVENFSAGMLMKLALCRTLLLNRKILFLDEPTLGLDVSSKLFVIEKLKQVKSTILLTSHDMSVVEKLCDRIGFIKNGQIIKIGTKEDIKKIEEISIKIEVQIKNGRQELKQELIRKSFIDNIEENKKGLVVSLINRNKYQSLLKILSNYPILKVKEQENSLEDLFLYLNS